MEPDLKANVDAASANLAEAFSDWHAKANKPEQDLVMQEVSDAWDLLLMRDEQYIKATAPLCDEGCADCPPEEHEHTQVQRDA